MGVTEGEDAAVGSHHEVAAIVVGGHHANDGSIETVGQARAGRVKPESWDRAVVLGVAVGEDTSVGGIEPVATLICGWDDADDGALEFQAPGRAVELGRAEAEDPAV